MIDELNQFIQEGAAVAPHLEQIRSILEADVFEEQMGAMMRDYMQENFRDIEDYSVVVAMLGATKIISAYNLRRVMES